MTRKSTRNSFQAVAEVCLETFVDAGCEATEEKEKVDTHTTVPRQRRHRPGIRRQVHRHIFQNKPGGIEPDADDDDDDEDDDDDYDDDDYDDDDDDDDNKVDDDDKDADAHNDDDG